MEQLQCPADWLGNPMIQGSPRCFFREPARFPGPVDCADGWCIVAAHRFLFFRDACINVLYAAAMVENERLTFWRSLPPALTEQTYREFSTCQSLCLLGHPLF